MDWLTYFQQNRQRSRPMLFETPSSLDQASREVLARSLQRFQLGERGNGDHLRAAAATYEDWRYRAALDLFIQEEQEHARLLRCAIEAMDGTVLADHWSDRWFVRLRHRGGLTGELLVLLAAELIGLCYYRAMRDGVRDQALRALFTRLVRDEEAHVAFHCDALRGRLSKWPRTVRGSAVGLWQAFYVVVATVVTIDHGAALAIVGRTRQSFLADCEAVLGTGLDLLARAAPVVEVGAESGPAAMAS